jgi:hypothetical protein
LNLVSGLERYGGFVGCYFLVWVFLYVCGRGKVDFVITGIIESYALFNTSSKQNAEGAPEGTYDPAGGWDYINNRY